MTIKGEMSLTPTMIERLSDYTQFLTRLSDDELLDEYGTKSDERDENSRVMRRIQDRLDRLNIAIQNAGVQQQLHNVIVMPWFGWGPVMHSIRVWENRQRELTMIDTMLARIVDMCNTEMKQRREFERPAVPGRSSSRVNARYVPDHWFDP